MALENLTVRQLIELDACTRCGLCIEWCSNCPEIDDPIAWPREKLLGLKSLVRKENGLLARLRGPGATSDEALDRLSMAVYDCTLCARCAEVCPVGIDTRSLWLATREELVRRGHYPEGFDTLRETVTTKYNISGDDPEERLIWSENLEEIPQGVSGKDQAEIVYFVGCTPSFYPQTYGIPQAAVTVMEKAGLDYTVLGSEEQCCGYPLIIAGMGDAVKELVEHNVEAVRAKGLQKLVAGCPSCYHTWLHEYPKIIGEPLGFEVQHMTQLLEELLAEDRIRLGEFPRPVTYHDPCDLGRNSGVYDAPRNVLRSIPGLDFVEMEETGRYALCCGGGGDVAMWNQEVVEGVARRRLHQAQATGAQALVSACQQCKRTLMTAARQEKVRMQVLDIIELVARVMED
jgi:heterodisulfide reductase subunit D